MRGVVYMLTGTAHAAQLCVSLFTLRKRWRGPVAVICGCDESDALMRRVAQDTRAQPLDRIRWNAPRKRNEGYANKAQLPELSPFNQSVFLDADTLVAGDVSPLFPQTPGELVITHFSDWVTTGPRMRKRIEPWRAVAPMEVARMLGEPYSKTYPSGTGVSWGKGDGWPAINTGVIGFDKFAMEAGWPLRWQKLCAARLCFICDELAMQLLYPDYQHRVMPHAYNASVTHSRAAFTEPAGDPSKVVVWHGHGSRFVLRAGSWLWLPVYQDCIKQNFGGLAEWTPAGDKDLGTLLDNLEGAAHA